MNLTRRELLQRVAILAAALPMNRLSKPGRIDKENETHEESETVEIYRQLYPWGSRGKIVGWTCKGCELSNTLYRRHCLHCGKEETAIPITWTCSDCKETNKWASQCQCYNAGHDIQNRINPFWLG